MVRANGGRRAGPAADRDAWAHPLETLVDPQEFLQESFVRAGGNLAVAVSFLSSSLRREARIAFLLCRVLDAFEDLSPDPNDGRAGIRHTIGYLAGERPAPPDASALTPRPGPDALERAIALRLDRLREELVSLPVKARARVLRLVRDVGEAMDEGLIGPTAPQGTPPNLPPWTHYGERVLGRVAAYALSLIPGRRRWPVDCASLGRLTQAANLLRDLEADVALGRARVEGSVSEARARLLMEVMETAPQVTSALAALRFPPVSRSRAAVCHLAATTAAFFVEALGGAPPSWLAAPPALARRAAMSARYFRSFVCALERLIDDTVGGLVTPGTAGVAKCQVVPVVRRPFPRSHASAGSAVATTDPGLVPATRIGRDLESRIAGLHPDVASGHALNRSVQMAHLAMRTTKHLSAEVMRTDHTSPQVSSAVLACDYLLACSVRQIADLGHPALQEFADLVARLAVRAQIVGDPDDSECEIAGFLASVVGTARGLSGDVLARWVATQRAAAARAYRADRARIVARSRRYEVRA